MAIIDQAGKSWTRFDGGTTAPIGSYICFRPLGLANPVYKQDTSDVALPAAGTWYRVGTAGNESTTTMKNTINTALSTTYAAADLTAYSSTHLMTEPGQPINDQ